MSLAPCASCRRHIREDEGVCPFCAHASPSALPSAFPLSTSMQGASRAQLVALGLLAATSATACSVIAPAPVYGGPPPQEATVSMPAYGMPVPSVPPPAASGAFGNGGAGGTTGSGPPK